MLKSNLQAAKIENKGELSDDQAIAVIKKQVKVILRGRLFLHLKTKYLLKTNFKILLRSYYFFLPLHSKSPTSYTI